jgi:Uma2 family endonuclease
MSVQIAKRLFSVHEYERMVEAGILTEDDRVELIEGEIVEMSPIGKRHAACVNRLNALLGRRLGREAIVSVQNPVQLGERSEPQPDLTLLRGRDDFYEHSLPTPEDVLLLIEVSDTTLEADRQIKLPLYARAGIVEVWLVNLNDEQIEVYAQPAGGSYQFVRCARRGESINAQSLAGLTLDVDAVLG